MPALGNPRYEAFAQAIFRGLGGETFADRAASTAYRAAGYRAKPGNSSEAAASRLLRRVKPILERVNELQEIARKAKGVTLDSIVAELEEARGIAACNSQASAMVAASATKARLFGLDVKRVESGKPGDFSAAQSSKDIARKLLEDAGAKDPTQSMVDSAILELQRHANAIAAIAMPDTANMLGDASGTNADAALGADATNGSASVGASHPTAFPKAKSPVLHS